MSFLDDLSNGLGISMKDLRRLILTAPKRYKEFEIPKRSGGTRTIAQPSFELKELQRYVVSKYLNRLPIHDCAYAYVQGRGIRENARRHIRSDHILKLDFRDFFHSIRPLHFERALRGQLIPGIRLVERSDLDRIIFWGQGTYDPRCLSIGAPSSPVISNVVMYRLDKAIADMASDLDLVYTRYADDLTLSSSSGMSNLLKFEKRLPDLLSNSYLHLELNAEKRGLYGRGDRRMVTGLILTPDHRISIGRERKRVIRAMVHRHLTVGLDERSLMRCKGMLAFVISAEPSYLKSLRNTFGAETIREILRTPPISFYVDPSLVEMD